MFQTKALTRYVTSDRGRANKQANWYVYSTADDPSALLAAGYFTDAIKPFGLKAGDIIQAMTLVDGDPAPLTLIVRSVATGVAIVESSLSRESVTATGAILADVLTALLIATGLPLNGRPYAARLLDGASSGFYYDFTKANLRKDIDGLVQANPQDLIATALDVSSRKANLKQTSTNTRPKLYDRARPVIVPATKSSFFNVPDALGGVPGEGFTNTGLTRVGTDFMMGNVGLSAPGASVNNPSIVRTDAAGAKVAEIDLLINYAGLGGPQGLCYDTMDPSLWVTFPSANTLWNMTLLGAKRSSIPGLPAVNAVAVDTLRGQLWIISEGMLKLITKAGTVVFTVPFPTALVNVPDQLCYDAARDILWITGDIPGSAAGSTTGGLVAYYPAQNEFATPIISLADVTAIEGAVIVGDTIYVNHDGYYHAGTATIDKNQMQTYTLDINAMLAAYTFPPVKKNPELYFGNLNYMRSGVKAAPAMTLACRCIPEAANRIMFGCQETAGGRAYLGIASNGRIGGGVGGTSFSSLYASTPSGAASKVGLDTTWMMTFDGTTVNLYDKKGNAPYLVYTAAQSGEVIPNLEMFVGAANVNGAGGNYAQGPISKAFAIDRVLTAAERDAFFAEF